jgi:hypothetical protein
MGGMEKQLLNIADELTNFGHDVFIISLDQNHPKPFFEFNSKIKFIYLNLGNSADPASNLVRLKRQIATYKAIKTNNISTTICFMTGAFWFAVIPAKIANSRVILAERNGPSIYTRTSAYKMRRIYFLSMVLSNNITVQFPSYICEYPKYLRKRMRAIPNYITEFGKIMNQKSTMIKVSKSIPRFFHKSILYFYYIPKYF